MLKNYLKIAWRNLLKSKGYTLLNIGGLAVGMACSILILLWVQNELSYDKFHQKANQIYRLTAMAGSADFKAALSPAGMGEGLMNQLPEIESALRLSSPRTVLFDVDNLKFEEEILYADSNFLEMFDFSLLKGNRKTALESPDGVLITETIARKYFGEKEALGEVIRMENSETFRVTGILKDIPENSHLQFNIVLPMSHLAKTNRALINKIWDSFDFYTYLQFGQDALKTSTAYTEMLDKINEIFVSRNPEDQVRIGLQPMTNIHLRSDLQFDIAKRGNIQYVNIFFVVALIILLVACINFMNLATARSAKRAKEVGLRKVVGAERSQLIFQFLSESLLVSFLSMLVAFGLVYLLLPLFNSLAGETLNASLMNVNLILGLFAITLFTGVISGSYPAMFLSSFKPVSVLKGTLRLGNANVVFRNGLVVIQFAVSVLLLVGTAVVYKQLQFIKNKNLGFERENLVYVPLKGDVLSEQEGLKDALRQYPSTSNFTLLSDIPTNLLSGTLSLEWEGKTADLNVVIPSIRIDENFIDVFKIEVLSGRSFSEAFSADSTNFMINKTAADLMGMDVEGAIGQKIVFQGVTGVIVGVVNDFNFKPLQYAIEPLVLEYSRTGDFLVVRSTIGNTKSTIDHLENIYEELNPGFPLAYNFIDKDLENQYRSEQRVGAIFNLFTILAIFISALGLYGLSAFMAERRIKEIGVRKVLGASVSGLVNLLSKDYLKLVFLAFLIASPISWYLMRQWLNDFAYRIELQWWMFACAGVLVVVITLITVSFQTFKAANTNPIKSLRTE